jgi:1-acyl-sn-glycerol-3-phosphate acyltransferase
MDKRINYDTAFEHAGGFGFPATAELPVAPRCHLRARPRIKIRHSTAACASETSILWKFAQTLCRILTSRWFDLKVYGLENVPLEGGVLLVCNHQSNLDPVLIGVRLKRPISYVGKSELFQNRYGAALLRWLNAFPIRQGHGDVGAVKETIARLKEGRALVVFPEGSRTPDGRMLPLQGGVGLVVRRANVPVVPAAIDGSFAAWPIYKKFFRRSRIRLVYGPSMDLSALRPEEIVQRIEHTLREMFQELQKQDAAENSLL